LKTATFIPTIMDGIGRSFQLGSAPPYFDGSGTTCPAACEARMTSR